MEAPGQRVVAHVVGRRVDTRPLRPWNGDPPRTELVFVALGHDVDRDAVPAGLEAAAAGWNPSLQCLSPRAARMGRSSSGGLSRPMNDWMTSVADIPGDADDDLPEISPELVLVDPELARIMRERQPAIGRAAIVPTLRLLPAVDDGEAPIVPRASPADEAPASEPIPRDEAVAAEQTTERPRDADPTPAPSALARDVVEESTALVPAAPRVVEAEPARVVAPAAEEPAVRTATPAQAAATEVVPAVAETSPPAGQALPAAMPHPIARPERERSQRPSRQGAPKRRGRGAFAFVAAVAAASVTTLGILNLSGGSSSTPKTTAAISGGPSSGAGAAAKAKTATRKDAARPKVVPKPKATTKAKVVAKPKAVPKPKATAKPKVVAKPKTTSTPKSTTKPKTTKPKVTANTPPAKPASKPKARPATPKPAVEPRRFAWAPVDGAVSYHVELFRGADRVLAKETTEPILELGSSWRYEGKTVQLTPGSYRWYVWPVTKSGRATQAVVQAKLDIP